MIQPCWAGAMPMTKRKNENAVKFCIVCGRRSPEDSSRKKICSKECDRRHRTYTRHGQPAPFEYCTEPPIQSHSLGEINAAAMAEGLSYGQYILKLHNGK